VPSYTKLLNDVVDLVTVMAAAAASMLAIYQRYIL